MRSRKSPADRPAIEAALCWRTSKASLRRGEAHMRWLEREPSQAPASTPRTQ